MEHENIVIRWILSHDIIFHGQVDNLVNRSILLLDLSISIIKVLITGI